MDPFRFAKKAVIESDLAYSLGGEAGWAASVLLGLGLVRVRREGTRGILEFARPR